MTLLGLRLIIFGMNTLSGLRAYVVAGGRWSEAERAAVYSLLRYTVSYDEKDYQNFTELMNTVSLPKRLRAELEKKNPEFDLITGGFEGTGEGEAGGVKRFTVLIGCPGRPRSTLLSTTPSEEATNCGTIKPILPKGRQSPLVVSEPYVKSFRFREYQRNNFGNVNSKG